MKKIFSIIVFFIILVIVSGPAWSYFEDGRLIRVVYDREGVYEVVTDLGAGWSLTDALAESHLFSKNTFSLDQLHLSEWSNVYVAYFIVTRSDAGQGTSNRAWTSGIEGSQSSNRRLWQTFLGGASSIQSN